MQKKTLFISRLSLLIALTLVIQIGGLPQPITGPLINAMLFITVTLFGYLSGIILGCVTPLVAIVRGQLPPLLAPMVPFIAISNGLLVLVYFFIENNLKFSKKRKQNPFKRIELYLAIILASVSKFVFLSISIKVILPLILAHSIPNKLAILMTTPQLITALIGGGIALTIYEILFRAGVVTKYGNN